MTSLISWIACDDKPRDIAKEASIYIASDSRISLLYGTTYVPRDDDNQKVFISSRHPVIAGYSGYEIEGLAAINELMATLDTSPVIADYGYSAREFFAQKGKVLRRLRESVFALAWKTQTLHLAKISWKKYEQYDFDPRKTKKTELLINEGSGQDHFAAHYDGDPRSESIFRSFCESLSAGVKPLTCGGPPQLASIYRGGQRQYEGVFFNNKPFYRGRLWNKKNGPKKWKNELFEDVDEIGRLIGKRKIKVPRRK